MIRALCLNPAIDRNYYINDYQAGGPYRNVSPHVDVGGKGINAAKVCSQLGTRVAGYGFVGMENCDAVLRALDRNHIENHFLSVQGETRTTINIIDHKNHRETEIIEPGPYISQELSEQMLHQLQQDIVEKDIILCSGLSAPGIPKDFYATVSKLCQNAGAACILDTNGQNLLDSLSGRYLMMKPNARELAEICDRPLTQDIDTLIRMARQLLEVSAYVLVSMGESGGLLVSHEGAWLANVPQITAVSTIGCGDSAVAGFAVATERNSSVIQAMRLALACGTANALTSSVGLLDMEQLTAIASSIVIQPVEGQPENVL